MPKVYSNEERQNIKERLKCEANILMREKGVKKTTVDELVKRVDIPKGTFYLFYSSKEELFFEVSQNYHKKIDLFLEKGFKEIIFIDSKEEKIEKITNLFLEALKITYNSCLAVLLEPEVMNSILSKLPEKTIKEHLEQETYLPFETSIDVKQLKSAFMMIIFGGMYKKECGNKNWESSLRLLIRGLVIQMVK